MVEDGDAIGLSIRSWSFVPGSAGRLSMVAFEVPGGLRGRNGRVVTRVDSISTMCPWVGVFLKGR